MNHQAIEAEFSDLEASYAPMVESITRVAHNQAKIITLEGEDLHIRLNRSGWEVLNHPSTMDHEKTYETVEALLMAGSPEFCRLWEQELSRRLEKYEN